MIEQCVVVCRTHDHAKRVVAAMAGIGRGGWIWNRAVFVWTPRAESIGALRRWARGIK